MSFVSINVAYTGV